MSSTRVLVVEDNPADFRLLQEALHEVGAFSVKLTGAATLQEATRLLQSERFDVALVDLSLPDTDGLDGIQRIQRAAPELPVLVLTGRNDSNLAVTAVREGAQDYLVKGQVDGQLLVRAMRYAEERKRNLLELQRSEQRFRSLLENALDIIALIDAQGKIRYASPSVERVLGYRPDQLLNVDVVSLIHPGDLAKIAAVWRPGDTTSPITAECRIQHKDGRWRVLEAIGRSLLQDPIISAVVINARDISERKEAEEGLREANERLQGIIEASPLAIYIVNLQGRVLGWNAAAEDMFGWTENEVVGQELPTLGEQTREELHQRLRLAREGKNSGLIESQYRRKDGAAIDVNIWSSLLRDESGRVTAVVALVADVTERRKLEEQFRQAQKMEAIGRLAGGVAHDFNNLLTVITGYCQLAANRLPRGSQASGDLDEVLGAADRAAGLTRQLLMLSRHQVAETVLVSLNTVVTDILRMITRVIGEDIQLETRLSPALRSIRGDRAQLELVLLNMCVNARDAMPDGGTLTIETCNVQLDPEAPSRAMSDTAGEHVMLAVTDTGCGMDASVRAHIFEPFYTTKDPGKGTGLGLSTSYGIVRQHGGNIWVYSEAGAGTTFNIYLPVADSLEVADEPPVEGIKSSRGTETILLVEDDLAVACVMRRALELEGYRILLATEPALALELAADQRKPIDLLVSDMVLHTMHGVDLARQIGTLRPGIKTLFVSGHPGVPIPSQPFLGPGVAFLQKPFAPDVLAVKVREVLNEDRGRLTSV